MVILYLKLKFFYLYIYIYIYIYALFCRPRLPIHFKGASLAAPPLGLKPPSFWYTCVIHVWVSFFRSSVLHMCSWIWARIRHTFSCMLDIFRDRTDQVFFCYLGPHRVHAKAQWLRFQHLRKVCCSMIPHVLLLVPYFYLFRALISPPWYIFFSIWGNLVWKLSVFFAPVCGASCGFGVATCWRSRRSNGTFLEVYSVTPIRV